MKTATLTLMVSALTCLAGDPDQKSLDEKSALIHSLPSREQLLSDMALARDIGSATAMHDKAIERLKNAQEGFERLKSILHPGDSVFDYPGLIALGRMKHNADENHYSIVLGIPPGWNWKHAQGTNRYEYIISFDGHGTITGITFVFYTL